MNINEIIKYPVLSEKTYSQMSTGVYTFAVDKKTNKVEIKNTVEFIFDVKVEKVNIINVDKKPTKVGRFAGFKSGYKKAIVKLAEGQINLFPEDVVPETAPKDVVDKQTKVVTKKMSDAEAKAAAKIAAKVAEKTNKVEEIQTTKEVEKSKIEEIK